MPLPSWKAMAKCRKLMAEYWESINQTQLLYIAAPGKSNKIYIMDDWLLEWNFSTKWIICALNRRKYICVLPAFCAISCIVSAFGEFLCVFLEGSCNCGYLFGNGINFGAVWDFPGFCSPFVADTARFWTIAEGISFVSFNRLYWFIWRFSRSCVNIKMDEWLSNNTIVLSQL